MKKLESPLRGSDFPEFIIYCDAAHYCDEENMNIIGRAWIKSNGSVACEIDSPVKSSFILIPQMKRLRSRLIQSIHPVKTGKYAHWFGG